VVATLVRLRFLLLRNQLTRSPWQLIATILGAAYGLFMLVLCVIGLFSLSFVPLELARTIVVLVGAAVVLGWTFLPVVTSGIDQTVDPARLAPFPIRTNTLLVALLVSGVLGVPGIVTSVAALGTALTWSRYPLAAIAAVVCAAIGVLTAVAGSRMLVAVASRISSGRRAREAKTVLVMIPLILLGPIIILVSSLLRDIGDVLPVIGDVVGFTPFGAAWAVSADLAAGEPLRAALEFAIAVATLAVVLLVWRWALGRALERPAPPAAAKATKGGLSAFGWFPDTAWGAVASRALIYWMRDPRYSQSLISVPLVPLLIFFYAGLGGDLTPLVWVGPILAVLLALSIYTDVSYDNTAFALHVSSGVSGRDDRLGRVVALATFAVPVTLVVGIVCVGVAGRWDLLLPMLGLSIGALLTGFGVASVASGAFLVQVPAPGENPFKSKPGGGMGLMLSMFATWSILALLVIPELVLSLIALVTGNQLFGVLSIVVALVLGTVLMIVGINVGGRILDRKGPELLTRLRAQK
jgi:ABC-2 type transport system permease protein